jgi:hypothetical protein
MSNGVRLLLTFACVAIAAFLAADPVGIPDWVNAVGAAIVAGAAAIGIPAANQRTEVVRRP